MSRPPKRRLAGVRFRSTHLLATVSVRVSGKRRQLAKAFPPTTEPDTIIAWQIDARKTLRKGTSAKGTLAAGVEAFLALPYLSVGKRKRKPLEGRTKKDLETWLTKWASCELGTEQRDLLTPKAVEDQLHLWQAEGYAEGTLNKMRQAFITMYRELDGVDHRCPASKITKFDESGAVRRGFFEQEQLTKVLDALPPWARDVAEFASFSGWRRQEVQKLLWAEVDLPGGVIRLSAERSKNRESRILPIVGPIREIIERRAQMRDAQKVELPYVFWRSVGGKIQGHKTTPIRHRPIGDWRKVWRRACAAAGCEGALVHDFRRTVVRNLTRAGLPEKVSMGWTGHKTRSVFDRYNIVNEADLRTAGERLAAHVEQAQKPPKE